MTPIYLDNNATTRTDTRVVAAMLPFFTEQFGNASSAHSFGADVATAIKRARRQVQALLGAEFDHEVIFTSGGSEADSTAIHSALAVQAGRDEIVISAVEHPAILSAARVLEERGVVVRTIPVDAQGRLDLAAYRDALSERTALVSVMWANNETGAIFPVEMLAQMAHAAGALFHTDAVQAAGRIPMHLKSSAIDMLSLSAHKFHGPKGVGALYLRKGVKFHPLILGGPQERRRRAGTENTPGIVGLGKAAEIAAETFDADRMRIATLRDRLEQAVLRSGDCVALSATAARLPNTSSIAFAHLDGEAILHHLGRAGVAASLGSACASGSVEPSHVLRAMNVAPELIRGVIRFSLSRETTGEEIDRTGKVLASILERLRASLPERHVTAPAPAAVTARPTELVQ